MNQNMIIGAVGVVSAVISNATTNELTAAIATVAGVVCATMTVIDAVQRALERIEAHRKSLKERNGETSEGGDDDDGR